MRISLSFFFSLPHLKVYLHKVHLIDVGYIGSFSIFPPSLLSLSLSAVYPSVYVCLYGCFLGLYICLSSVQLNGRSQVVCLVEIPKLWIYGIDPLHHHSNCVPSGTSVGG